MGCGDVTGSNDGADDEDAADPEEADCELVALTEELWEALAEELVSVGAWEVLLGAAEVVLASPLPAVPLQPVRARASTRLAPARVLVRVVMAISFGGVPSCQRVIIYRLPGAFFTVERLSCKI
uniref:hypothetical protein n=1 Tax=Micrococcus sp. V7 TaxID=404582 RepID=UPI0015675238|nr:hypothetical protein [Micrococcus sp. V7]